jgi:hypothetical protein
LPQEGEARVRPFLKLETLMGGDVKETPYGTSLTGFDVIRFTQMSCPQLVALHRAIVYPEKVRARLK